VTGPTRAGRPGWTGRRPAFAAALVLHLVVLYLPRAPSTGGIPLLDKAVHLVIFALVGVTAVRAGLPRPAVLAVLLAHAVVSEVIQATLLPDRSGDPLDSLADGVGVLVALALTRSPLPVRDDAPVIRQP